MRPLEAGDPARIAGFTLSNRIGGGGMGMVYLGHRDGDRRTAAIKVIRPDLLAHTVLKVRFDREVAAARSIRSPRVAEVLDSGEDQGRAYLAVEYVPGPTVYEAVLGSGPLSGDVLDRLAAGLAEAVAAIHAADLVHRDLTPRNVILAYDGPKVIDFGLAYLRDATQLTQVGEAPGTPGFRAPERWQGLSLPAGDVYSFGALLCFASTGRVPASEADPRRPDLPGVPTHLADLLERCLAEAPAMRPNAVELVRATQRLATPELPASRARHRAGSLSARPGLSPICLPRSPRRCRRPRRLVPQTNGGSRGPQALPNRGLRAGEPCWVPRRCSWPGAPASRSRQSRNDHGSRPAHDTANVHAPDYPTSARQRAQPVKRNAAADRFRTDPMSSPLAALEAIDWAGGVTDCYGPVDELPTMLRATLSADQDERREALEEARNLTNHQGDVCEASVHIVPFLARAALAAPYDREAFLYWLAWSCGREDESALDRTGLIGRAREATALALPELAVLIRDPEPEIRRATLMLIAAFPHEVTAQLVNLTALRDPDPLVRADLLTVVAFLQPSWAGLNDWLTERLGDEDTRVRFHAARVLMRQYGTPYPQHLVDALADAIAEIGKSLGLSEAIDSFCGATGHSWPTSQATGLVRVRMADPLVQDPTAAAHAARRILHSASPHAGYALKLVQQIDEEWRDQEREAAAVALDALPTVTDAKTQYSTLRWIARMLSDIEQPDEDLLSQLERWSAHSHPAIAAASWTAAARIDKMHALTHLNTTSAWPHIPADILHELCEIYGSDANGLIHELRRRIEAIPRSQAPREADILIGAVRDLDARAHEFLPLLRTLIESGQGLYALLETLGSFGPAAADAADLIETVARTHERQHFRLRAARAHRAITGQAALARQVAAHVADGGTLENFSDVELGLLGPDAAAGAELLEQQFAKGKASQAILALWRITRDRERFAPLLARAALSDHGALPAVQGLAEIGACPAECRKELIHYAAAPQRILHTTLHHPTRLDDYLLRRLAQECLNADHTE